MSVNPLRKGRVFYSPCISHNIWHIALDRVDMQQMFFSKIILIIMMVPEEPSFLSKAIIMTFLRFPTW